MPGPRAWRRRPSADTRPFPRPGTRPGSGAGLWMCRGALEGWYSSRKLRGEPSCTNIQLSAIFATLTEVSGRLLPRFDRLNDRRLGDQDDWDRLEVIQGLLPSSRPVLLEHLATMPAQIEALFRAKLAYVER